MLNLLKNRTPILLLSLFGLALFAASLLSGCCALGRGPRRTCVSKKGCPPKTALRRCGENVTAIALPLGTVLARGRQLDGKTVTVRSRLRRGGAICTLLACAPGTCCNGCGAMFMLTTAAKPDPSYPHTLTLMNVGQGPHPHDRLACGGDDSGVCCPFRTGQQVVATGTLRRRGRSSYGDTWTLENPRLCRP